MEGKLIRFTAFLEKLILEIFCGDYLLCLTGVSMCNLDSLASVTDHQIPLRIFMLNLRKLSWSQRTSALFLKDYLFSVAVVTPKKLY